METSIPHQHVKALNTTHLRIMPVHLYGGRTLFNLGRLCLLTLLTPLHLLTKAAQCPAGRPVHKHNRSTNKLGHNLEPMIWEESDTDSPRQAECGDYDADSPLRTIQANNAESATTDKGDGDLTTHHDAVDNDEEEIAVQASEDVEAVIQSSVVELVEDLHPDEGVEHNGSPLVFGVVEEVATFGEVEDEGDGELENCLADDHLPHGD